MIENILDKASDKYFKVKEEILKNCSLTCRCTNPGTELKCAECPEYLNIVNKIQKVIHSNPETDCFNPLSKTLNKEINHTKKYQEKEKSKAIALYLKCKSVSKVSSTLNIPYATIYTWVKKNNKAA